MKCAVAIAGFVALSGVGCSRTPARVVAPEINSEAGAEAVTQYDKNGDGQIAADELAQSPALKAALGRLDADANGQVSAAEVDRLVGVWKETRAGIVPSLVFVKLDGAPLAGAEVTMLPESFLGDAVQTARGVTDARGSARPMVSDQPAGEGVHPGLYRIQVSKKEGDRELIPARYNEQTTLGAEISSDLFGAQNFTLELSSR